MLSRSIVRTRAYTPRRTSRSLALFRVRLLALEVKLRLETVELKGEPSHEQAHHGTPEPRFGTLDGFFVLLGEQAALPKPGEGALDPPAEPDGRKAPFFSRWRLGLGTLGLAVTCSSTPSCSRATSWAWRW